MSVCIQCFRHEEDVVGADCLYGLDHLFAKTKEMEKFIPSRKRDAKLCLKCGLHPKNPTAAVNNCQHEFRSEE
jgi:hypothetical protein